VSSLHLMSSGSNKAFLPPILNILLVWIAILPSKLFLRYKK
jgi:hypothetical protein